MFTDVPTTNSNYKAIKYIKDQGIAEGYANNTFQPNFTINRAEFTKIIIKAKFSNTEIDNCISSNINTGSSYVYFPDVSKNSWYAKYVCIAKKNNIINGYPDTQFKPANTINFAEAAKIIINTFGYTLGSDTIWYKPYIDKLKSLNATPPTVKGPDYNITRGEMAEMIYKLSPVTN